MKPSNFVLLVVIGHTLAASIPHVEPSTDVNGTCLDHLKITQLNLSKDIDTAGQIPFQDDDTTVILRPKGPTRQSGPSGKINRKGSKRSMSEDFEEHVDSKLHILFQFAIR